MRSLPLDLVETKQKGGGGWESFTKKVKVLRTDSEVQLAHDRGLLNRAGFRLDLI